MSSDPSNYKLCETIIKHIRLLSRCLEVSEYGKNTASMRVRSKQYSASLFQVMRYIVSHVHGIAYLRRQADRVSPHPPNSRCLAFQEGSDHRGQEKVSRAAQRRMERTDLGLSLVPDRAEFNVSLWEKRNMGTSARKYGVYLGNLKPGHHYPTRGYTAKIPLPPENLLAGANHHP